MNEWIDWLFDSLTIGRPIWYIYHWWQIWILGNKTQSGRKKTQSGGNFGHQPKMILNHNSVFLHFPRAYEYEKICIFVLMGKICPGPKKKFLHFSKSHTVRQKNQQNQKITVSVILFTSRLTVLLLKSFCMSHHCYTLWCNHYLHLHTSDCRYHRVLIYAL